MNYDDNWGHLHIHFKPGKKYHMNGDRPSRTAASATTRAAIRAASSGSSKSSITSPSSRTTSSTTHVHIAQLIDVINKNVMTNLTFDEDEELAWAFRDRTSPTCTTHDRLRRRTRTSTAAATC
jgi:hypothetical protein